MAKILVVQQQYVRDKLFAGILHSASAHTFSLEATLCGAPLIKNYKTDHFFKK